MKGLPKVKRAKRQVRLEINETCTYINASFSVRKRAVRYQYISHVSFKIFVAVILGKLD